MTKVKVFRIEHQDNGYGPYCYNNTTPTLYYHEEKQPVPEKDGMTVGWDQSRSHWPKQHRFGFVDTKALKEWFDSSDRLDLKDYGFVCRVYEVDETHVLRGRKQVIFDADRARIRRQCQVFGVKR